MPKVSEEYKKNRRSQIVETARECFIKHGYQKASMSEIIAATGLSAGAIYNHFSSKDEIILAAARMDMAPFDRIRAEQPWDYVFGCLKVLDTPKIRRHLLVTWGEAVAMPQLATAVSEQLSYLRDQSLERYRAWGAAELDFTEEELEEWLTVIGAAVLSVLTGYVVQTQLVAGGKKESAREAYLEYASAILRQA